ncbi:hypothetical protein ACKFKG_00315 [Phormidesmis sp. 146-35]
MFKQKLIDVVLNSLIPSLTQNVSIAAQSARDGAQTMLSQGAGLVTKAGDISRNPQAFGFAFEHLQAIGFNINAALRQSAARAYQIPADGSTKFSPDLYIELTGKVVAEIQAKAGSRSYVQQHANLGHYAGEILTNTENAGIVGTTDRLRVDGVESIPVSRGFAEWVAENPYFAASLIYASATTGEIVLSGVEGAVVQTEIEVLLQSIKVVGAYCRGEQALAQEEAYKIAKIATESLKDGFIRGVAIKILQRVTKSKAFASLGFTVGSTAIPVAIQVLRNELTLQDAIEQVGHQAFTAAVITPILLLFPPIGTAFISAKVLQAIWAEISPEWKASLHQSLKTTITDNLFLV